VSASEHSLVTTQIWRKKIESEKALTEAFRALIQAFESHESRCTNTGFEFDVTMPNWREAAGIFKCMLILGAGTSRRVWTENGYVGMGLDAVREGDYVCAVQGASAPYIFREPTGILRVDGLELLLYELVGDAYVHGIMSYEALQHGDPSVMKTCCFVEK
jgi:hypothetical protein